MKGVSTIIVVILILLIGIALVTLTYSFFINMFSSITESTEEGMGHTVTSMMAQIKIESIETGTDDVHVRNIGKVNLTGFSLYINDTLDTGATSPNSIGPGKTDTITSNFDIISDDVVKVTTAQGATAIQKAP